MGTTSVRRRVTLGGVASAGTTVREGGGGAAVGGVASAGTTVSLNPFSYLRWKWSIYGIITIVGTIVSMYYDTFFLPLSGIS